jgi:peptidyl-prolyl cis-trans isomerase D
MMRAASPGRAEERRFAHHLAKRFRSMAEPTKLTLKVIVTRIIVGVMFSMLILSFAVWGIGDIFRAAGHTTSVASVGPVRISPQQFQDAYRRELRRLQSRLGETIDAQRARELHLPQRVVQDMVARTLFELAARDAGVAVSDGVVRQAILDNPGFHDSDGKFDRERFNTLINNAGYSEDGFIDLMRHDLARAQVTDAVTAGSAIPPEQVTAIYKYRNERRTAEIVTVASAAIKTVATPSDADLEGYHKDHADKFTAPEYRAVTAVHLTTAALAPQMKVSDDKIKDEYEARASEFQVPEQRAAQQILVSDEAKAKQAEALLAKGAPFDQVAKTVTGAAPIDLGMVQPADLLGGADLAKAVFALKAGESTAPVQSALGWHIVQVTKIVPARAKPLAEVHDQVLHDVQLRAANDAIYGLGNKLQDLLGGGSTLEEAAQKLNIKLVKIAAVDAQGNGPDGKPVAELPQTPKFIPTVFATVPGQPTDLIDDGSGGYLVIRVDKAMPSAIKPLAQVRDEVIKDWQDDSRLQEAEKTAAALLDKAKGGAALGTLAQAGGFAYTVIKPVNRTGEGAGMELPPELVAALFAAKPGEVVKSPAPGGAMIAKLKELVPADPSADKAGVAKLADQLRAAADNDLLDSYEQALSRHYGVEINSGLLESLIGS